jgi:AraC-like DNA-binding protein
MNIQQNPPLVAVASSYHLDIVDSGLADVSTDWQMRHVSSPYTRLYVIYGGGGRIHHHGRDILLKEGCAYLIPAQLLFDYACDNSMTQLYFHLNLYAADGHDMLMQLHDSGELTMTAAERSTLLSAWRGDTSGDALQLMQQVQALIARCVATSPLGRQGVMPTSPFLQRVYALARQPGDARNTVNSMAGRLSMSPSTLAKRFKAETGTTLGRYLEGLLLQKAQQKLLSTDEPIGRIAEALGFCDQFYFSRYFKQRRQETPSRYRQRLQYRL